MNDEELRARFQELRDEEARRVPPFVVPTRRKGYFVPRLAAVAALLLLVVLITVRVHTHRPTFSTADRAAARSVAEWRPPTAFLLRTPGSEILATTPVIPDVSDVLPPKGAPR